MVDWPSSDFAQEFLQEKLVVVASRCQRNTGLQLAQDRHAGAYSVAPKPGIAELRAQIGITIDRRAQMVGVQEVQCHRSGPSSFSSIPSRRDPRRP